MSAEPWTFGRLLQWTTGFLKDKQADSPRLDAEVLLAHVVGCQRIALYTRFDEVASDDVRNRYKQLVKQRVDGCPVAYLVGFKEFYNLRFAVSPAVLIPRPETELLVMEAIRLAKPLTAPRIIDVGTGTGAIALTLAKHLPHAHVTAVDISPEALEVAKKNAEQLGLVSRVRFQASDLLAAVASEHFDFVVSNPPYIASEVILQLPVTVKNFEPKLALDGGVDGTQIIERLGQSTLDVLNSSGYLLLEIGADQGKSVPAILTRLGYSNVTVLPDHAGLPRVVKAQRTAGSASPLSF